MIRSLFFVVGFTAGCAAMLWATGADFRHMSNELEFCRAQVVEMQSALERIGK